LRIGDPDDLALLAAVARGEFATAGFRNRDLRPLLCSARGSPRPMTVPSPHESAVNFTCSVLTA